MLQPRVVVSALALELANDKYAATDKLKLFKSTFTPNANSVLADFTANEVDFTGYTAQTLSHGWTGGVTAGGDAGVIYTALAQFLQTGDTLTDIAGGFWIENTGGTVLLLADTFDAPIVFDTAGNEVLIKPSEVLTENSAADVEVLFGP